MPASNSFWSSAELQTFLTIMGDSNIQAELDGMRRNEKVFKEVSQRMAAEGFQRTSEQCRAKLKKTKARYRKVKDSNGRSGNGRSTWKWYDVVDAIYGHRPSNRGSEGGLDSATSILESLVNPIGCPNAVTDVNSEDWAPTVHPGYLKCNERPQTEEASCQRGERAKAQEVAANLDDVLCDEGSSIPDVGFSKEAMVPKAVYDDLKQKYSQLQAECDNLRVDIKKLKLASIKFLD
nr:uncharacterized protein LOC107393005 [Nothobranchius furzeri]